jgi:hypothetical protein
MNEFGTGLRAHLGHEPSPEPAVAPAEQEAAAPEPDAVEVELEQRLAYLAAAEAALVERERLLAEREDNAEAALVALAEEEERLAAERERIADVGPTGDIRSLLRKRAAQHADLVWGSFEDALRSDDLELRLLAARTLVGDVYAVDGRPVEDAIDELAQIRQRRTGG